MIWDFDKFKDRVAVYNESGERFSYADIEFHGRTLQAKIPQRSLVLQLCRNDFGSLLGYITLLNNKIVPILLKESLSSETLQMYTNRYQPNYIYLPDEQKHQINSMEEIHSDFGYTLLKTKYPHNPKRLHENLALLLTTSGSTGSPKLVRLSYQNLNSNTKSIVEYLNIHGGERAITSLPMNYTYGLSVINSHLYAGASILLTSKTIMQKTFWQQMREFNITTLAGVPYTYEMLDKLKFIEMDFPNLKTLTQAGGKLSIRLHEKFANWAHKNKKNFVVMYGQTEATARMSYLPSEKSIEKLGSIGVAIPGGQLEIIDGELIYKGDNVALGYADSIASLSLGDEFKGVLHTGDMAKKDQDGFLYITGRKTRFLKIYGNRVNLDEVEMLIKTQFSTSDCACAGYDDKMFIFICDKSLQDAILNYIVKLTSLHPTAFRFIILERLPKTEVGKTLYHELEQHYA